MPCTDRRKREKLCKKKMQTDPTGDTNGYGEKRGKTPFLYCNRSVELRMCVWSSGNGGNGNQATGTRMSMKAEIMINPSGKS
jgi:hypothetical protein